MAPPITSGSKNGCDQPPCANPPSGSSSTPPGACTTPSKLMNSMITMRMTRSPHPFVTGRGSTGRVRRVAHRVRVRHAHLALEPVGIHEEEAQDRAEIRDEPVGSTLRDQALADLVEGFDRRGLQSDVVDPTASEHRRLPLRFGIAFDLEDVELVRRADVDE